MYRTLLYLPKIAPGPRKSRSLGFLRPVRSPRRLPVLPRSYAPSSVVPSATSSSPRPRTEVLTAKTYSIRFRRRGRAALRHARGVGPRGGGRRRLHGPQREGRHAAGGYTVAPSTHRRIQRRRARCASCRRSSRSWRARSTAPFASTPVFRWSSSADIRFVSVSRHSCGVDVFRVRGAAEGVSHLPPADRASHDRLQLRRSSPFPFFVFHSPCFRMAGPRTRCFPHSAASPRADDKAFV